jgi:hypothetical protein
MKARKISGKFDMFGLKHVMLDPGRDVNPFLQVKPRSMHNLFAVGLDLQKGDHVTLVD